MKFKQRVPLLRWSFWRMAASQGNITTVGQVGDGREAAVVEYVLANARKGDIHSVLDTIDRFAYNESFLSQRRRREGQATRRRGAAREPETGAGIGEPTAATAHCGSPRPHRPPVCTPSNWPRRTPSTPGGSGSMRAWRTGSPAWWAPSVTAGRRSTPWQPSTASVPVASTSCSSITTRTPT